MNINFDTMNVTNQHYNTFKGTNPGLKQILIKSSEKLGSTLDTFYKQMTNATNKTNETFIQTLINPVIKVTSPIGKFFDKCLDRATNKIVKDIEANKPYAKFIKKMMPKY